MYTLPTTLTLFRLFVGPVYLIFFSFHGSLGISSAIYPLILIVLLITAEVSDWFDGYFARKYGQVTNLGKVLDPMADQVYHFSIFLIFTKAPFSVPIGYLMLIVYRESIIGTLRLLIALNGTALAARTNGKIKAAMQGVAAITTTLLLFFYEYGLMDQKTLSKSATYIMAFTAFYTVYSGIEYLLAYKKIITKSATKQC